MEESFNISNFIADLDISALCCDEEFDGFDKLNGNIWIYPTNYPVRDYQYNIIKAALFKNTLVSLPTGLGKTFIAAVIMYNFYRWYPTGKIIFVAPTRPLVAQQIDACYNIMAIPPEDTIEMTGTMSISNRKIAWLNKRVIFATPQVVQNDLTSGNCPSELVRCLVIDEAHKAKGRYSFCQIVEYLTLKQHHLYRILALSATPGSKIDDVIQVVKNLKISHLELRSEECIDVAAYSFSRKIQTVIVPFGEDLSCVRKIFFEILDKYTRRLVQYKVLTGNIGTLSKGRIIMLFKEYQNRERSQRHSQHGQIMLDFTMVITLYHALELLTRHGARVFLNFFDEHPDKTWVSKDDQLVSFLERLREDLGVNPMSLDLNTFPDGSFPEIKENIIYGHPKFDHLKQIILEHFNNAKFRGQNTKAIVFCEYRESVNLVHCLLLQCRPLVKPQIFIGQGPGSGNIKDNNKAFSQKQQLKVMKLFREGVCNVLVSTCVGEEGLDIGNVDLIICFDISNKSPVRLVQRCGRTGRERSGHVVILVTEGKEHQTLRECMYERDNLNKKILQSKQLQQSLFKNSPRMIPSNFKPECQKMYITVVKKHVDDKLKPARVQTKLKDMLIKINSDNNINIKQLFISKEEFMSLGCINNSLSSYFFKNAETWTETKDFLKNFDHYQFQNYNILSKWTECQKTLQYVSSISHSTDTQIYCKLLQFADSKRFNLPADASKSDFPYSAQLNFLKDTVAKKKTIVKRQTKPPKGTNDIRQMFRNIAKANNVEEVIFSSKLEEMLSEFGIDTSSTESINLHLELENVSHSLVDLMVELELERKQVHKDKLLFFSDLCIPKINSSLPAAVLADYCISNVSCIDSLSSVSWHSLKSSLNLINPIKNDTTIDLENYCPSPEFFGNEQDYMNCDYDPKNSSSCKIKNNEITKSNCDLIDLEGIFEDSVVSSHDYENYISSAGSNEKKEHNSNPAHNLDGVQINNVLSQNEIKNGLGFFGLDDIDAIFGNSSTLEEVNTNIDNDGNVDIKKILNNSEKNLSQNAENGTLKNGLEFFGLDDIEDIYSDNSNTETENDLELNIIDSTLPNQDENSNESIECILSPVISTQIPKKSNKKEIDANTSHKLVNKSLKQSADCNSQSTLFSISQAINFISSENKSSNILLSESKHRNGFEKYGQNCMDNFDVPIDENSKESDESDRSLILCSQAVKPKFFQTKTSTVNCNHSYQLKPNIIIPASSEESDTSETECAEVNNSIPKAVNFNANSDEIISNIVSDCKDIPAKDKRYLSSEEETSPFFCKLPRIGKLSLKNISLIKTKKLATPQKSCLVNNLNLKNYTASTMKENISPKSNETQLYVSNVNTNPQSVSNHFNEFNNSDKYSPKYMKYKTNNSMSVELNKSNNIGNTDSDDDFIDKSLKMSRCKNGISTKKRKKGKVEKVEKKRELCEFIDYEAILSDDSYEAGSSENSDGSDTTLGSFICDENIEIDEAVDIESKYLQSVKSPLNVGKFKIPKFPVKNVDVFSQECPVQDTSYELDSFCVENDCGLTQVNELTDLEVAESLLRKRKRRKFRRIVHNESDLKILNEITQVESKNKKVRLRINSDSE